MAGRHVTRRRFDGALAAAFLTDAGGAIPVAFMKANHRFDNANAWDLVASVILGVAGLTLAVLFARRVWRPWVEWTLRIAGATWVAYGTAILIGSQSHDWGYRIALFSIFGGIGFAHLTYADRIERGEEQQGTGP